MQTQYIWFDSELIQKVWKFQIHITALSKHSGELEPLEAKMSRQMGLAYEQLKRCERPLSPLGPGTLLYTKWAAAGRASSWSQEPWMSHSRWQEKRQGGAGGKEGWRQKSRKLVIYLPYIANITCSAYKQLPFSYDIILTNPSCSYIAGLPYSQYMICWHYFQHWTSSSTVADYRLLGSITCVLLIDQCKVLWFSKVLEISTTLY